MEEPNAGEHHHQDDSASTTPAIGNNKTAQCSVVSIYQVTISNSPRNVTVSWSKNIINHSLSVTVDKPVTDGGAAFTCKVDLKPWPFWSKKGFKTFEVDGIRVDVFWDLRSAKFSSGPEPTGGYYVALVCNEEVVLLLGDCKKEAYKRTKSRPSLEDPTLLTKKENIFGKRCFTTRMRFDERKKEHDILIESSISGPKEPEMWISVDGEVLIHVSNLQWKFRGNETVMVEERPVQILWDAHDWLFGGPGMGHALFIFKPGAIQKIDENHEGDAGSNRRDGENGEIPSVRSYKGGLGVPDFCFFLCAWKME